MKRITDDVFRALIKCTEVLPETELSRRTGVGLWQIKRFLNRQTDMIRGETWDKIYPVLKPYLSSPVEAPQEMPPVIGRGARRHKELVDMCSDQKVLLDMFNALGESSRRSLMTEWQGIVSGRELPHFDLKSLSREENRLMGIFMGMSAEERAAGLKKYCEIAMWELKKERQELF